VYSTEQDQVEYTLDSLTPLPQQTELFGNEP
jgi:hypothetical protein